MTALIMAMHVCYRNQWCLDSLYGALIAYPVVCLVLVQQRWPAAPAALLRSIRLAHHVAQWCEAGRPNSRCLETWSDGSPSNGDAGGHRTHRAIGWRATRG